MTRKSIRVEKLSNIFKRGFTLMELLVVISIISLLMSILLPCLRKVKRSAERLVCVTQMRDIGLALGLYMNDNKDRIPWDYTNPADPIDPWYSWMRQLGPYYGKNRPDRINSVYDFKLFRCPTQNYITKLAEEYRRWLASGTTPSYYVPSPKTGRDIPYGGGGCGVYGLNANYFYASGWRYFTLIVQPGTFPLLGDNCAEDWTLQRTGVSGSKMNVYWPHPHARKYGWPSGKRYDVSIWGPAPNHGDDGINYLFGDFHCETKKDLWPWHDKDDTVPRADYFHPKRNQGIPSPF